MTKLTGSEKQVKWANEIRDRIMSKMEYAFTVNANVVNNENVDEGGNAVMQKNIIAYEPIREALNDIAKASWWIDRKNSDVNDVIDFILREMRSNHTDLEGYLKLIDRRY